MKLLHQFVAALFFIYHAYATSTNTEPCEKKDDSGTFLFICLVVGFCIIKHSEDQRRDRREEAYYDSDEDEESEAEGDGSDTEEDSDAEEPDTEEEGEEDDSDAEESEVEDEEPVDPQPTRKSRRLGSKATLADSHS